MRYGCELTIPANTPETALVSETVSLVAGIITEVEVMIPAGHQGLAHCWIEYHHQQIYPTTPGLSIRGDNTHWTAGDKYPVIDSPHELEVVGYNLDDTYDHTFFVRVSLSPLAALQVGGFRPVPLPG